VGGVLGRGFSIWGKHVVPFTLIALVTQLPALGYAAYGALMSEDITDLVKDRAAWSPQTLIGLVCFLLNTAALIHAVSQALRGRPVSVGASLKEALRRMLPVVSLVLVVALITVLFVLVLVPVAMLLKQLAIVPGLIALLWLVCQLWVAVPALVLEGTGPVESLQRSSALTLGYRWHVLAIVLVLFGIQIGLALLTAVAVITGLGSLLIMRLALLVPQLLGLLTGGLFATINVVAYHDLRASKEGVSVDDIAKVFD